MGREYRERMTALPREHHPALDLASKRLRELGIRHLVIGHAALVLLGVHCDPHALAAITLLVGPEALELDAVEAGMACLRAGIPAEIDRVAVRVRPVRSDDPVLIEALGGTPSGAAGALPAASLEVLAYLALAGAEEADRAVLADAIHADVDRRWVLPWFAARAPHLQDAWQALLDEALSTTAG